MTAPRTIVVCVPRPLFAPSALEQRARHLVDAAIQRGCDATVVSLPCGTDALRLSRDGALAWTLVDLSDLGTGQVPDTAICLHPDALFVHHPTRVAWLPPGSEADVGTQRALRTRRPGEPEPRVVASDADTDAVIDVALAAAVPSRRAMASR